MLNADPEATARASPGLGSRGAGEDRPAGIFMSVLVALAASVVAIAAAIFARNLQSALSRAEGRQA